MDRTEAAALLRRELLTYTRRSRTDLSSLIGQTDAYTVRGDSGVEYQVEVNAMWDDQTGGTIRVLGAIDDGTFRSSFSPLTDDFLVDADGGREM